MLGACRSWLAPLERLAHWAALRGAALRRVRAACLVECQPPTLAAYFGFLARHALEPAERAHLTDLVSVSSLPLSLSVTYVLSDSFPERLSLLKIQINDVTKVPVRDRRSEPVGLVVNRGGPECLLTSVYEYRLVGRTGAASSAGAMKFAIFLNC